jgi:hypothetical protein
MVAVSALLAPQLGQNMCAPPHRAGGIFLQHENATAMHLIRLEKRVFIYTMDWGGSKS